jgi:hypothetical protein
VTGTLPRRIGPGARIGFAATFVLMTVFTAVLTGCGGSERSPEAYCKAFYETAAPIRETYVEADENVEDDPIGSIATVLQAPGDMVVIFSHMSEHAPDEIRSDTEAAQHSLEDQQDSLGDALSDPLGALGSGLVNGLTSAGSFSRVDAYLNQHCPVNSDLAQSIIN